MTSVTLRTEDLDYDLPEGLIATSPEQPRDQARMMVLRREADTIEHRRVCDLPEYLSRDDLLVMNDTSVVPARVLGTRLESGGRIEGLFLDELEQGRWRMMLKSNGKLREGIKIALGDESSTQTVIELIEREGAQWIVKLHEDASALDVLERIGRTPLPPYIIRARGEQKGDDALDRSWYQTVYADFSRRHSVAAPTAGLHFTPELLAKLDAKGIARTSVTLHVGPGTFKPVTAPTLEEHEMHWERYEVGVSTLQRLTAFAERREQRESTGALIAIGTTSVRTLESLPESFDPVSAIQGETDLLIMPPYDFRFVDGLLTNFHLPRSTLLALVGALVGLNRLKELYHEAIQQGYRFYSYGDAMLILP
ncbi:MAG: tRNA preQ1(34) S-adenosylmethionine ribosyltransferase-isomerase QueA [Planctomycetota bacterium]|nr:tRNA preQ1(34) S-adenosylmethionine ribosyltransferase-isomerase QueA [Planctomycetota bacterium]